MTLKVIIKTEGPYAATITEMNKQDDGSFAEGPVHEIERESGKVVEVYIYAAKFLVVKER